MVRTKTVAAKAGGDTVACGVPTPTEAPVLTQDVEAAEAASTEAAQRVQQLRATLDGDSSKWSGHGPKHDGTFALSLDGDDDVVNLADLLDAASGGHTLDNTLAHLRLVLHLLRKQ